MLYEIVWLKLYCGHKNHNQNIGGKTAIIDIQAGVEQS